MTILDSILLGILQGFTEFLPISSSGHLVLAEYLLGVSTPGLVFEVTVHLGSLISILIVFWQDIKEILLSLHDRSTRHLILVLVVGTIPAVLVGLLFKDWFAAAFDNIALVGATLMLTGIILISTRFAKSKNAELTYFNGLIIGIAQSLAITPGISRSGSTIAAGLILGISSKDAARFSFLLAIPAIVGAGLLTGLEIVSTANANIFSIENISAFFTSLVVGVFALKWLLKTLKTGKFHWFGIYCLSIGLITLICYYVT